MIKFINSLLFIIIGLISVNIKAENSISPGRPGAANPMTAMPIGQFQFEVGYNFDLDSTTTHSAPYLFRTGVYQNLELQLGYNSGYSVTLLYEDVPIFKSLNTSILVSITPDQNNDKKIDTIDEINFSTIDLYIPWSLNKFPISGQLAKVSNGIDFSFSTSASIGKKIGVFVELFESDDFNIWADSGFTYLLQNNIQLDFSTGIQIDNLKNYFLEAGLSYRLPK